MSSLVRVLEIANHPGVAEPDEPCLPEKNPPNLSNFRFLYSSLTFSNAEFYSTFSSLLPARATRLLNRSRLQQSQLSNTGSDSPRSIDSLPHKHSRSSLSGKDTAVSSDDLLFADKSFRNSMIQDVQYFKKQLIRLRRVLQDVSRAFAWLKSGLKRPDREGTDML